MSLCRRRRYNDRVNLVAIGKIPRWLQDHLIALLDALIDLDLGPVIGCDRNLVQMDDVIFDYRGLNAVLIEMIAEAGTIWAGEVRGIFSPTVQ
jgi:hypothetical protein